MNLNGPEMMVAGVLLVIAILAYVYWSTDGSKPDDPNKRQELDEWP